MRAHFGLVTTVNNWAHFCWRALSIRNALQRQAPGALTNQLPISLAMKCSGDVNFLPIEISTWYALESFVTEKNPRAEKWRVVGVGT